MSHSVKVIAVTGPTATGKTALAIDLARRFHGEIVSVDSRQFFRGMDLGTGKDLAEYREGGEAVPYHLIDIADPNEEYNLARFVHDAYRAIGEIAARDRLPILCGGSAMYLDALLQGYRLPGAALPREEERHRQNREAAESFVPPFRLAALTLGVYYPRAEVRERIARRLDARLNNGMIEEVAALHAAGVSYERLEFFGLEYREIARFLQGQVSREAMREELLIRIRQFAKRQDIFFRKMEREGVSIHWLKAGSEPDPVPLIRQFLAGEPLPPPAFRMMDTFYGRKTD